MFYAYGADAIDADADAVMLHFTKTVTTFFLYIK